jgi:tRNA(Arg) A34 adenosine deaminase TadA
MEFWTLGKSNDPAKHGRIAAIRGVGNTVKYSKIKDAVSAVLHISLI